ncbi:MAG: hypothetical protein QXS79_00225 [Candidatus Bathyarchaeia archaeon]
MKKDEVRQETQNLARRTTRISKQVIFSVHRDMIAEAENLLREAEANINELVELSKSYPEICIGLIDTPLQEYAEAKIFLELIRSGNFMGPREVGVPGDSYVLGLADVVGELRRRALDLIRRDDIRGAEECLNLMETIYSELIGCDELQALIPGLRRKCDIARRIVEATRGDVTIEGRRTILNNAIKDLQRTLKSITSDVEK